MADVKKQSLHTMDSAWLTACLSASQSWLLCVTPSPAGVGGAGEHLASLTHSLAPWARHRS